MEMTFSMMNVKYGFSLILFVILSFQGLADGTKQLRKTSAEKNCIQLYDRSEDAGAFRKFATYEADSNQRLYFTIHKFEQEVVLFGFRFNMYEDTVYFRIKDKEGKVVFDPMMSPKLGSGFIKDYAEATKGPYHSTYLPSNEGGYEPLVFIPEHSGDYYIEFNIGDPEVPVAENKKVKHFFEFFDLTIADVKAHKAINGRVWSKAWDFNTQSKDAVFTAPLYIYSDDGVITMLDFNGIKPWGFVFSCNATGTSNTGNFYKDRQSVLGDSTYPQYKVFLTYPDTEVFLPGALSSINTVTGITCAEDGYCVNVTTTASGTLNIVLEFNGIPEYQQGSADVALNFAAPQAGTYCIKWDGLDGKRDTVKAGTVVKAVVVYQKGLTNLPIYDVEDNPNGYIVTTLVPEYKVLELHWDNSLLEGTVNLTGCTPDPVNEKGCLGWPRNMGDPVKASTIEKPVFGNNRTFNSWWFAGKQEAVFSKTVPTRIIAKISSDHPAPGTGWEDSAKFCSNEIIEIIDLYEIQNQGYQYQWFEGESFISGQKRLVLTNVTEDKELKLIVSDPSNTNSCKAEDTYVLDVRDILVPNLITPNDDQKNDRFEIKDLPAHTYIEIFNRWGDLIYKNENYNNEWPGEGQSAVYYFQTKPTENCGAFKGWLQVME